MPISDLLKKGKNIKQPIMTKRNNKILKYYFELIKK